MRNIRRDDKPKKLSYYITKSYCKIGKDPSVCELQDDLVTYAGHELKHCGLCPHHVQDLNLAGLIRVGTDENRETIMLMVNYETGHLEEVPIAEVRCCSKEDLPKVQWNDYLNDVSFRMQVEKMTAEESAYEPVKSDEPAQLTLLDCLPAEEKIKLISDEELKERFLENF